VRNMIEQNTANNIVVGERPHPLLNTEEIRNQKEKHFARKEKVLGQFMTPPEVANFIVDFALLSVSRKPELAIDPACGDGVFLEALIKKGISRVVGIDIDKEVIPDNLRNKCEIFAPRDGLLTLSKELEGRADIVVGNPPFSAKYGRIKNEEILSRFELGKRKKSQAIEILFLERFIQLASDGGVIGIILPSSIFSNVLLRDVREFIISNTSIIGIVSLPRGIFRGTKNTTSKTNILFAKKGTQSDNVFMGIANKLEDLFLVLKAYKEKKRIDSPPAFWATNPNVDNLSPEFYFAADYFESTKNTMKLGELVSEMFCGKTEYGPKRRFAAQGIRFISAKTVTPLGIDFNKENRGRHFVDPKSEMYKQKAHVEVGDLLFVRVGVGCIGKAAVVTKEDERGVADDWIYIIRPKKELLSYYLAFYLQSKYGISQVNTFKRGVGTVTIPQRLLKNLVVPVLSEPQLQKFKELYLEMAKWRQKDEEMARKIFHKAVEMVEKVLGEKTYADKN